MPRICHPGFTCISASSNASHVRSPGFVGLPPAFILHFRLPVYVGLRRFLVGSNPHLDGPLRSAPIDIDDKCHAAGGQSKNHAGAPEPNLSNTARHLGILIDLGWHLYRVNDPDCRRQYNQQVEQEYPVR